MRIEEYFGDEKMVNNSLWMITQNILNDEASHLKIFLI